MTTHVANAATVVEAFANQGRAMRTPACYVPGGHRVRVEEQPDGSLFLYSYRTLVAVRRPDGSFALTTRQYSVSTSKLMGRIERAIRSRSWTPDGGERNPTLLHYSAAVPGRHGGYGIPWHPTGVEEPAFVLYT